MTTDPLLAMFNAYYQKTIQQSIDELPMMSVMLGYHLGWNDHEGNPAQYNTGKQIRPLLALLSCGARGGQPDDALPLAAAIELLHNFSLIHDDIMDVSEQRRGRASIWHTWGVNQAINVGDGAYGLSFQLLAEIENANPQVLIYAQRLLSKACVDTVYGQMLDISFESRETVGADEYTLMTGLKSGPLIGAALGGGVLFAGASWAAAQSLSRIGRELGVVFQMQDDILGVWGQPEETGKSANDDLTAKKKSLPVIWAMEHLESKPRDELVRLYSQEAPLSLDTTSKIRVILTDEGVQEAVETDARLRYDKIIADLKQHYPDDSPYRETLFNMVTFIVNRTH